MKLLFVCLGNICRSPTAEGVMRHLLAERGMRHVEVDSCGTGDWHVGEPPDRRTVAHAARRGYDLSPLRARALSPADFHDFDHLLAMDHDNLRTLQRRAPAGCRGRLSLFLDGGRAVPDPWSGDAAGFEEVLDLVEQGCRAWADRLVTPG